MNQVSIINASILSNATGTSLKASSYQTSDAGSMFANVIQNTSAGRAQQSDTGLQASNNTTVDIQNAYNSSYRQTDIKDAKQTDFVRDEIVSAASEVTENIKDELGVTDEQIAEALETLGLGYMDLLTTGGLTQVVQRLTGTDSAAELIVSTDFTDVLSGQTQILSDLSNETMRVIADYDIYTFGAENLPDEVVSALENVISDLALQTEILVSDEGQNTDETVITARTDINSSAGAYNEEQITSQDSLAIAKATVISDLSKASTDNSITLSSGDESADITLEDIGIAGSDEDGGQADAFTRDFGSGSSDTGSSESESDILSELFKDSSDEADTQVFMSQTNAQQIMTGQSAQTAEQITSYIDSKIAQDMITQVSDQVVLQVTEDAQTMELQLNPENLGKLIVSVTTKQGEVTAQLKAETEAVRAALESQVSMLKESLAAQGLKVTEIEVTVADHKLEENLDKDQQMSFGQAMSDGQEDRHNEQSRRNITKGELDSLSGLMTEEEILIARIMSENGNTMDLTA